MHYIEGILIGLCIPILFPDFYSYLNKKIRNLMGNVGKDEDKK